jgi:hypothetical protein
MSIHQLDPVALRPPPTVMRPIGTVELTARLVEYLVMETANETRAWSCR